jgi:outer membrane lipoprotein SlyB
MFRLLIFSLPFIAVAALAGCAPDYSPNTYAANAVQQANKVEPGVVVGYRQVEISANGTVGAVSGGAAGGILGSQVDATGIATALSTLGGTIVGGVVGTTIEHAASDTTGWEYIVRKPNGDLLSVTQREPTPIAIGQKVLVITGNQARVVPDYSVAVDPPAPDSSKEGKESKDKSGAKETAPSASSEPAAPSPPAAPAPPAPAAASPTSVAASPDAAAAPSGKPEEATPTTPAPASTGSAAAPQTSSP